MKHARRDYDRLQDPLGKIPLEEPVFLIRGQDVLAIPVVSHWLSLYRLLPDAQPEVIRLVEEQLERFADWPERKSADL